MEPFVKLNAVVAPLSTLPPLRGGRTRGRS